MQEESKHALGLHPAADVSEAAKSETNVCMLILFNINNRVRYSLLRKHSSKEPYVRM